MLYQYTFLDPSCSTTSKSSGQPWDAAINDLIALVSWGHSMLDLKTTTALETMLRSLPEQPTGFQLTIAKIEIAVEPIN